MNSTDRRWSAQSNPSETTKFPDFDPTCHAREHFTIYEEKADGWVTDRRPSESPNRARPNGVLYSERWAARKDNNHTWANGFANGWPRGHNRQRSLTDAIKIIRGRQGSVSANAQEIAEALRAPVSVKLVVLCLIWYLSSALTNTSSKSILNAFPRPITLTIVQFAFVSLWCFFLAQLAKRSAAFRTAVPALKHGIRPISREVVVTTLPLALFQLGGHVLSSTATAQIPVSLVHTIKGLSPLFTVLAYRMIFNIHYSMSTYLSLVPLTLGVILACSVELSGNISGILSAFFAALIFVSQNIFSKKLFNEAARAEADALPPSQGRPKKLDKLNLLCYSSTLAFLLTFPLWVWTEGLAILSDVYTSGSLPLSSTPHALDHGRLTSEFVFNGIFHFGQNIIAFVILSMISPVTYSVASLIKRVFVIVVAILWFRQPTTSVQAVGIGLTFIGLYLYDRTHDSARGAKHLHKAQGQPLLPLNTDQNRQPPNPIHETPTSMSSGQAFSHANGFPGGDEKRNDSNGPGRPRRGSWKPLGTKQEETWKPPDSLGNIR